MSPANGGPIRLLVAGTCDPAFHRNRIIADLLERSDLEVEFCHVALWGLRDEESPAREAPDVACGASRPPAPRLETPAQPGRTWS